MKRLSQIAAGIGVGVTSIMLAIAYLPEFFPEGYIRLQRSGLVKLVPAIAVIQIAASVAWLYISIRGDRK